MTNTNEEWKAVIGFEGLYEVSDLGRVRSVDRTITLSNGGVRIHKGRILKQHINKREGRPQVCLTKDRKVYTRHPYTLVALAFIGERPEGYHICHIDGDYTNNKLSNIRFDTVKQNQIDLYRQGKKSSTGKLSIDEVLEIRKLYATGDYKQVELAEIFNIKRQSISLIITRKTFPWLNDDGSITESVTSVS